jgi:hypothetical protein
VALLANADLVQLPSIYLTPLGQQAGWLMEAKV